MVQDTKKQEKLISLAEVFYGKLFIKYDDPKRALKVWFQHLRDLYDHSLLDRAKAVATEVKTSLALDTKLDILIRESSFKDLVLSDARGIIFSDASNVEKGDHYGNAYNNSRKSLEESL